MFTLRLLGGLRLENGAADPSGRATQRLRLAILALVSLAPGRRLTRDRLLSILWPEATADEGRRRLSSALYDMRRLLGDQAISSHGDELWLDPAIVRVDAEEFLDAVRREEWGVAATLYRGPFLDGVHPGDSAEFEEWLSTQRERLHRAHLGVVEHLGAERVAAGDGAGAAACWEQLVVLDPLAGRWTLELMRARAALNDRAGAIRAGEALVGRLEAALGIAPDPAVARLLAELRSASDTARHPLQTREQWATDPLATAPPGAESVAAPVPEPVPDPVPADTGRTAVPIARRPSHWARLRGGLAAMAVVTLTVAGLLTRERAPSGASTAVRVAVFPFTVTGASEFSFLQNGVVDLLSADLEGVGRFTTVDPHALLALVRESPAPADHRRLARQLGASRFVLGHVFGVGDSVRLRAALHDVATGTLLHEARAEGSVTAVPGLVDQLTAQLAAAEFGGDAGTRIASVAALTTRSIPALREFLEGEARFRGGRFGEAIGAFRRAVALDTTFALAHYRLSLAILWGNHPGAETAFHDSLALRHANRLSERDRGLVEAYAAWRSGRAEEALARYTTLVTHHPDDVEAWYQRGETEFHYGPQLGIAIAEAGVSFGRVLRLDPSHWGARWHLALLRAREGHPTEFRTRVAELLAMEPDSASAVEMQLVAGIGPAGGQPPALDRVGELELFGAGWRLAVYLRDLDGAARLFGALLQSGRSPYAHKLGRLMSGQLALTRGRWSEALAQWEEIPSATTFELQVLGAIIPGHERPAGDRAAIARRLEQWRREMGRLLDPYPVEIASALRSQALLAASVGDTATAHLLIRELEARAPSPDLLPHLRDQVSGVRAYLAWREGRMEDALRELSPGHQLDWYGLAVTSTGKGRLFERFLRAEILRELGRPAEALAWYRGFDEHAVHDLIFLGPALLRSAELNATLGRHLLAAQQRGRVAELWQQADPEYRALLAPQIALETTQPTERRGDLRP